MAGIEKVLEDDIGLDWMELAAAHALFGKFIEKHIGYERVSFREIEYEDDCRVLRLIGVRDETPEEVVQREVNAAHAKRRELDEAKEKVAQLERDLGGMK